MSTRLLNFVCPACGLHDFGRYCSNCSASLQLTRRQVPALLTQWLLSTGYNRLAIMASNENDLRDIGRVECPVPGWIPEAIIDVLSASVAEVPLSNVEFLAFDSTNFREVEIIAIVEGNSVADEQIQRLAETI